MTCNVCQSNGLCWHCQTCSNRVSSLRGGQCDSCYAKTLEGHFFCKECNDAYHSSLTGATLREGLCFKCDFWTEKVEWSHNEKEEMPIRIAGGHYRPGIANHKGGFGGTNFLIRMNDGRIFGTRNLWSQGPIPKHFRERLQDNAKFLDADCPVTSFLEL